MIFLSFLSVIGFTFFVSNYAVLRTVAPFFAIASVTLVLFLMGSMGILGIGAKILMVLGWVLLVFSCLRITQQAVIGRETLWQACSTRISLGTWFFVVIGIVWFILARNITVFGWDEFFWAEFVRAIKMHNGFYRPGDSIQQSLRYPPAIQLFQYFFIVFSNYKEGALYFAHGLIPLAATAIIIDFSRRKILDILLAILAPLICIIYFYGSIDPTIMNDSTLGIFFGVGLVIAIFNKSSFPKLLFILFPILALLPLIKETGFILSIILSTVFIVRLLLEKSWSNSSQKHGIINTILIIVVAIITPLATRKIWLSYLKSVQIPMPYKSLTSDVIKNLLFHPAGEAKTISDNFYSAIFTKNISVLPVPFRHLIHHHISFSGSIVAWAVLFSVIYILSIYFANLKNIKEFLKKLCLYVIVLIGLASYLLFLFLAYNLFFSNDEGVRLASYERYMTPYALALSLVTIVAYLFLIKKSRKMLGVILAIVALIAVIFWPFEKGREKGFLSTIWNFEASPYSSEHVYKRLSPLIQLADKYVPADANMRIFFVNQNSSGSDLTIFRYAMFPRITMGGSFGNKYSKDDFWTNSLTVDEFAEALKRSNYLAIGRADENFWQHYGSLFQPNLEEAKQHLLFKVIIEKDSGQVFLEPVE